MIKMTRGEKISYYVWVALGLALLILAIVLQATQVASDGTGALYYAVGVLFLLNAQSTRITALERRLSRVLD